MSIPVLRRCPACTVGDAARPGKAGIGTRFCCVKTVGRPVGARDGDVPLRDDGVPVLRYGRYPLPIAHDTPSLIDAADRLGVSQTTVKTPLKHCYQKTGGRRQTESIRLALASTTGLHRRLG